MTPLALSTATPFLKVHSSKSRSDSLSDACPLVSTLNSVYRMQDASQYPKSFALHVTYRSWHLLFHESWGKPDRSGKEMESWFETF
jgi:hypothetical protein